MNGHWEFHAEPGAFRIVPKDDRYMLMFEAEALDSYGTPQQALDDLIAGTCTWPTMGSPARLELPDDLSEWTFVPA